MMVPSFGVDREGGAEIQSCEDLVSLSDNIHVIL
jgi:hypothetical protein